MDRVEKRAEIEYKLLASAVVLDEDCRRKIFSLTEKHFMNENARKSFAALKKIFFEYPNADDSIYLAVLDNDSRKLVMTITQTAVSPIFMEEQLDDTLGAFRQIVRDSEIKSELDMLAINDDVSYQAVKSIMDRFEPDEDGVKDNAALYLQNYRKRHEVIPTGFKILDELLNGGFIKGTTATIGARPSTGKTTLAINIASHNRESEILFFSLEMSAEMIYDRIMSDYLNESYSVTGKHDGIEIGDVIDMLEHYDKLKIIDDLFKIEDITSMIYQKKPSLVIIDYVQIIASVHKFIDNRQKIDYISQQLKRTAKKTNCCILVLSQLARNAKEKPTMSALKESGGLEQDSDYIILLHRDYVNDKSNGDTKAGETDLILDKNKFGRTKELKFDFDGKYQRFTEIGEADSESEKPISRMAKNSTAQGDSEVSDSEDLPF